MNGPTVAEVVSRESVESLWHFLSQLMFTLEAQQFFALMIGGVAGMISHWLVKWARGEIAGSLAKYLLYDHVRNTILTVFTYVGFALTTVATPALTGANGGPVGWFTVLWLGITTGFSIDAVANKGERPVWTDEQRQKSTEPEAQNAVLPVTQEKEKSV